MSSLTPTARVILGMLKLGIRTGYDIKKAIDTSTRFFWGASFGQIYPELHRLREEGLVAAKDEPRGRVKRTEYTLTAKGEAALREWLTDTESFIFELRDEGLLRLFFGDVLCEEEVLANLRARREFFGWVLERFRELEVGARTGFADESQLHPLLALRYGIGLVEWSRDWYDETERRLAAGEPLVDIHDNEPAGG
jgi:PadR family transcriptional regulator, regulatory protein AphA